MCESNWHTVLLFSYSCKQNMTFESGCSTQFEFPHTLPLPRNNYLNHILAKINGCEEKIRKRVVDSFDGISP